MNEVIGRCPVCSEKMVVTRLECPQCGTAIEGKFELCKFCYLSKEQRDFFGTYHTDEGKYKGNGKSIRFILSYHQK